MAGEIIKAKEGDLQSCPFCGSSDIYYRKYDHAAGVRQLWNRRAK